MKFIVSQLTFLLNQQSTRRNLIFISKFMGLTLFLVTVYSICFHYIMLEENRDYSPVTGLYWTLTVMSTLGFGDITFTSDLGKVFTLVVLLSGILLFMLVLPFTFIRFVYSPWLDAQARSITPRKLPVDTEGHVLVVGDDVFALSIVNRMREYSIPYAILVRESADALLLHDRGYKVVVGDVDIPETYRLMRAEHAALVIALHDDMKNTNIVATVREVSPTVPIAARIHHGDSRDILKLAGATHVYHFAEMLGKFLARRVFNFSNQSNIIGKFQEVCIAEAPAQNTSLVGKTIASSNLRGQFGLNVAAIWQGNEYMTVRPDTMIDESAVLLLVGTEEMLKRYDSFDVARVDKETPPVLILGGGTVAASVAEMLQFRGIPFRIVEKNASRIPKDDDRYVHGSAADLTVLKAAGIDETQTVIVTTHDDDVNIYLTIYCRKLRPDIQIISRASLDRNVASLYNAGANLVMSQASMTATTVINLLTPGRIVMLTEGLVIFRVPAPVGLIGKKLLDSGIRDATDCNVIAIQQNDSLMIPPDPNRPIEVEDELLVIGSVDAEKLFMRTYGS